MPRLVLTAVAAIAPLLTMACAKQEAPKSPDTAASATVAAATPNACTPPTQAAATPEETAWRLFVAATCPVNSDKYPYVTWENWIEQNQLYGQQVAGANLTQRRQRFHTSPLHELLKRAAARKKVGPLSQEERAMVANQDCNTGAFGRVICEEARLNPDAQKYITDANLQTMAGQYAFVAANKTFQFPPAAVEIKADWIELASCTAPPANVHVETIEGKCYALAGMHLISKLTDKWIWATFEPQNTTTNPRRCQVLGCKDTWGSNPATTSGASTALTPALSALMASAKLAPEWQNYRLDGVQTDFMDGTKPTVLGNSIIEGENAGDPSDMKKSSCITCHNFSTIRADSQPAMNPNFVIGNQPLGKGMIPRDFVWSLVLAK